MRRRFRMDGLKRKVVSIIYNVLVRCLWPTMASIDINGSPKIVPARVIFEEMVEDAAEILSSGLAARVTASV